MKHMIGTKTSALRRAVALCMVLICLCGCALPLLTSCEEISGKVTTLYVYNWGEYISDGSEDSLDSNAAFEEWYYETFGEHVRVNYSTFSSNEDMSAKLASGSVSYDVVVPSDYMIQRLIAEGLVQKLDHENIPNLANLHGDFYGENAKFDYYDKGCLYSVPYMYGMVGIIYNTTMVDPDDPNIGSWSGTSATPAISCSSTTRATPSVPRSTCWDWTSIRTARQTGGRRWRSSRSRSALCRAMSWMRSTTRWRTAPPPLPPTTPGTS